MSRSERYTHRCDLCGFEEETPYTTQPAGWWCMTSAAAIAIREFRPNPEPTRLARDVCPTCRARIGAAVDREVAAIRAKGIRPATTGGVS